MITAVEPSYQIKGIEIEAYRTHAWGTFLFVICCIFTIGIFFVISKSLPALKVRVKYKKSNLRVCNRVVVKRTEEGTVMFDSARVIVTKNSRYFQYMCHRYLFNDSLSLFEKYWYVARILSPLMLVVLTSSSPLMN